MAKWVSADPIGLEGNDINLYVYSSNNSIIFLDKNGKEKGESFPIKEKDLKPKIKVIGGILVDEDIKDSQGNKIGHIDIGAGNIKFDQKGGVEGNLAVIDVEVDARIVDNISITTSAKAAKVKVGVSQKGGEVEVSLFEAGVGTKIGPVKAKALFGLSGALEFKDGKVRIKAVYGIGGEIEINLNHKFFAPVKFPLLPSPFYPNVELTSEEETTIRSSSIAYEDPPPPLRKTIKPKVKTQKSKVKYSEAFQYLGYPCVDCT
jgi:hypothetical protein